MIFFLSQDECNQTSLYKEYGCFNFSNFSKLCSPFPRVHVSTCPCRRYSAFKPMSRKVVGCESAEGLDVTIGFRIIFFILESNRAAWWGDQEPLTDRRALRHPVENYAERSSWHPSQWPWWFLWESWRKSRMWWVEVGALKVRRKTASWHQLPIGNNDEWLWLGKGRRLG